MSGRSRVLVCDPLDEAGLEILREVAETEFRPNLTPDALQAIIGDYDAVVVHDSTRIPAEVLESAYKLRAIGCTGARLDNIDLTATRSLGIEVYQSPSRSSVAIAERTLALLLELNRRAAAPSNFVSSISLSGKTLGIIGFGQSGRQVARRALAFDMRVIANQPRLTPELALDIGVMAYDLRDLLREADFVSLHVALKPETAGLIGPAELALMKSTACLMNASYARLVDEAALLDALENDRLAGAAVPPLPTRADETARQLRQHYKVIVAPSIPGDRGERQRDAAVSVARQIAEILRRQRPSETLSLEVVLIEQVMPHEEIDDKRVGRLMISLEDEKKLINPPLVTRWKDHYIILDGATRFTALKRLGFSYAIVQVVDTGRPGFALHTWYHAISSNRPPAELFETLAPINGLTLSRINLDTAQTTLKEQDALCYFLSHEGEAYLAEARETADRLSVMNEVVATYSRWGNVERTLLTDLPRLLGQFPQMVAVAVFPQFTPETVFEVASRGAFLPAGLTRFVIPGRVLRLNADLTRLKVDEPLAAKRAWFNDFLADKLARSRIRYYQEPVILLDE